MLGDLRLNEIDSLAVERYQKARASARIRPSTINDDVKVLVAILNYAREIRGLPVRVPKIHPLPVRGRRRNAEPWTKDEVRSLLGACAETDPELMPSWSSS